MTSPQQDPLTALLILSCEYPTLTHSSPFKAHWPTFCQFPGHIRPPEFLHYSKAQIPFLQVIIWLVLSLHLDLYSNVVSSKRPFYFFISYLFKAASSYWQYSSMAGSLKDACRDA